MRWKHISIKKKGLWFVLGVEAVFVLALVLVGVSFPIDKEKTAAEEASLAIYAEGVIEACSSVRYRPACYDEEIPKLMDALSMEEAFAVTKLVQEQDESYWYCHVLAHALGARETAKDPSRWIDVIARVPSHMCSNGGIHGAFQERFRSETLAPEEVERVLPDLQKACEPRPSWSPTSMEQATCYHALGHLAMYITGGDIHRAVAVCEDVARQTSADFTPLCYDGAFMQIFQPLEPEDFALIEGKQPAKEELASYCHQFSGAQYASCWSEGWPLYSAEIQNADGLTAFCSAVPEGPDRNLCFTDIFYVLTAQFEFDHASIVGLCSSMPEARKGQCFASAASRFIETDAQLTDRAVALCAAATRETEQRKCYEELVFYASYNFKKGSKEFEHLCGSLPMSYREGCYR
ncbi:MAG: hypothetical protein WD850_00715 [Candidatus Spechtbacterales bacterium]